MSQIILIDDNIQTRRLVGTNLEMYLGREVLYAASLEQALELIKKNKSVVMIATRSRLGDERTLLRLSSFLESNRRQIPIFGLGPEPDSREIPTFEIENWQFMIREAAKTLNITAHDTAHKETPPFICIPLDSFEEMRSVNVAVYVENNGDYKVIFKPGSKIYQDALNALSSKGVHTLYVSSMDRLKFTNHLSDEISHSLSQNLDDEKRILATEHAFNTTHSLIAQTGLNKQTIDMAAATIKSMAKMVSKSKELAKLWHFITSDKGSYLYQNALLSAMIAHEMVVKLEWGKSEEQQQKMAFTAFFHDITIAEEKLCRIHSSAELEDADLSDEEKTRVLEHAQQCCSFIKDFPNIPFGAEAVILQHHGKQKGEGLPDGTFDSRITPLAIVYMIAEDFSRRIIEQRPQSKQERQQIVKSLLQKYNRGTYRKVAEALVSTIS